MSFFVYIHTCPNSKKYVGVTTQKNIKSRWRDGWGYHTQNCFYRAINKYGWDNISHEVFETKSKDLMFYWERILIYHYKTNDNKYGYNRTMGGDFKHDDTWRKSLKNRKRRTFSEETRKKISEASKGHIVTEETRKKISEANKRRSDDYKLKISMAHKGKPLSEETKKKISQSKKGRVQSEEERKMRSIALKLYWENKRKNNT